MVKKIILVTGGSGLIGRAMQKVIMEEDPTDEDWIFLSSKDADLRYAELTNDVFEMYKPTHVIHLAAVFGGLLRPNRNHGDTMRMNMAINTNVLEAAREHKCQKVVSCMSNSIFPEKITYPVDETMIHNGPPHESLSGYAYAKRMLDVTNHLYYRDLGLHFTGVIPSSVYGPFDNFNLMDCNVLPALLHKCYLAKVENKPFTIFGTGSPQRQFIFADDVARLMVWALREYPEIDPILITVPEDEETSIKELAELIAAALDFKGDIIFDTSKSDGQLKRSTSNYKLKTYLPNYKFKPLKEGIKETVDWFKANYPNIRI